MSDLTWTTIECPAQAVTEFGQMKQAYRDYQAAKATFEGKVQALATLPAGQRLVFGYRFGKLSVAVTDEAKTERKAGKPVQSLDAFLGANATLGVRS